MFSTDVPVTFFLSGGFKKCTKPARRVCWTLPGATRLAMPFFHLHKWIDIAILRLDPQVNKKKSIVSIQIPEKHGWLPQKKVVDSNKKNGAHSPLSTSKKRTSLLSRSRTPIPSLLEQCLRSRVATWPRTPCECSEKSVPSFFRLSLNKNGIQKTRIRPRLLQDQLKQPLFPGETWTSMHGSNLDLDADRFHRWKWRQPAILLELTWQIEYKLTIKHQTYHIISGYSCLQMRWNTDLFECDECYSSCFRKAAGFSGSRTGWPIYTCHSHACNRFASLDASPEHQGGQDPLRGPRDGKIGWCWAIQLWICQQYPDLLWVVGTINLLKPSEAGHTFQNFHVLKGIQLSNWRNKFYTEFLKTCKGNQHIYNFWENNGTSKWCIVMALLLSQ